MALHIAVCDDERGEADALAAIVSEWARAHEREVALETFPSAEAFLFRDGAFDILLLDVELGGLDGVGLAKRVRDTDRRAEIIFVTSHAEFIGEGYEVDALHYLIKPVRADKLREVLTRAAERLSERTPPLLISSGGETVRLAEDDILYAEAFSHYIELHARGGVYRVREKLSELEERLSEDFFRVHRSYIVSLRAIIRITRASVTVEGGAELPLARGRYDAVNRAFIERN